MKKTISVCKILEDNNVPLQIRKPLTKITPSHTILTDDVFTYVGFYFKTHRKKLYRIESEKKEYIDLNYEFYWEQAKNFYEAYKALPIESAPLPMYYCILNAVKAYLLYQNQDVSDLIDNFGTHGLSEYSGGNNKYNESEKTLAEIEVRRLCKGVFPVFAKSLNPDFDNYWKWVSKNSPENKTYSVKELLQLLPFLHSTYVNTYSIPRSKELFLPIKAGAPPALYNCSDRKNRISFELSKSFFGIDAANVPNSVLQSVPKDFSLSDSFSFISTDCITKSSFKKDEYRNFRKLFCYINSPKRLWYLRKTSIDGEAVPQLDSMTVIMAVAHRLSEIVRYKPHQMFELLNGKESWLLHEFVNLGLDQFIDEIACEITGHEIMCTRIK